MFEDNDLIYLRGGRGRTDYDNDIAASSVCWEPNQIIVEGDGYTNGAKSIPFSVTHWHESEINHNMFFDDGGETFKFSMLGQTPK